MGSSVESNDKSAGAWMAASYGGPACDGTHRAPRCPDPKCCVAAREHNRQVREGLRRNEEKRRAEQERRRGGPGFGHEDTGDDE